MTPRPGASFSNTPSWPGSAGSQTRATLGSVRPQPVSLTAGFAAAAPDRSRLGIGGLPIYCPRQRWVRSQWLLHRHGVRSRFSEAYEVLGRPWPEVLSHALALGQRHPP